jgi:hypothetical protein
MIMELVAYGDDEPSRLEALRAVGIGSVLFFAILTFLNGDFCLIETFNMDNKA